MREFLLVCVGGAIGTGGRYWLSGWVAKRLGSGLPFGTLAVNVLGSFALALIVQIADSEWRLTLGAGVMGGFTTYSTFSHETFKFLQNGAWRRAGLNIGVTLVGCLLACAAGVWAGRWLLGR